MSAAESCYDQLPEGPRTFSPTLAPEAVPFPAGFPRTAITPEALEWGMRFLYKRYTLPLHIL